MAEHEINTIINVEARAKGSGTGGLGSVSKQLSSIANLTRVLRSSKELKDLPTIFADAHKHASAFVGSLGGVNKQLEQTVGHLKSLKGLGGITVGTLATTGASAQAAVAAAATPATKAGKSKGGRPKAPVAAEVAAAEKTRDKARVAKLEAAAFRDLAAVEALEYRANQHLHTAGKTNPAGLPSDEAKAVRERARDHKKGYQNWWKKELKAQEDKQKAEAAANKKIAKDKEQAQKKAAAAENSARNKAAREAESARKKEQKKAESAAEKVRKKAERDTEKRAERNAKVDKELDMFEGGFEGRAVRRRQEARKKRTGAFRQGFFQGLGGPQFLQRGQTLAQVAGYTGGAALRGGAILGSRAAGVGLAGATGGAGDMIQAIGALGGGIPVLEGLARGVAAALGRSYQASQQGFEFRRASNSLLLGEKIGLAAGRGPVAVADPAMSVALGPGAFAYGTDFYTRNFGRPPEQFGDDEQFRRGFEEQRAAEARQYATRMGLGVTEYLQQQRAFSRFAGYRGAVAQEGMFPTALGLSRVTGLDQEITGRLAQKLLSDATLSGETLTALKGLSPTARLDRMAMSPFVQAVRDGLNESDALEVLQDIAQQTIKGADLKLGSNAFMATMGLGAALSKTGAISPKTAYDITRGLGRKGQSLAYGAQSSSDLLFLKFFGDLDLGSPLSPKAYNTAIERAASQVDLSDPTRFEGMLRFLMNRMGGDPETAASAVSGEVNRILDAQVLSVPGARELLQSISGGKRLTAADLSAAGAVLPGLQMLEQTTGFAEVKKAETANREVLAGRKLLDSMLKLDEATARMVETVSTFEKEIGQAADLIGTFGEKLSSTIQALNDPQKAALDVIRSLF